MNRMLWIVRVCLAVALPAIAVAQQKSDAAARSVKIQLVIAEGIKGHTASLACAACGQRWRQELLPIDLERLWRAASFSRGARR